MKSYCYVVVVGLVLAASAPAAEPDAKGIDGGGHFWSFSPVHKIEPPSVKK